ncbi:hypothetical protein EUGRSUZ_J01485 [Eucalyptus grandis]|uniref:Uncharacterized protein n=3 Tax=Eucalyptus grandis TaxID=71139 RepID=A0A059AF85_EUCGR|nr:hypothetical protein EUGRSUZ_J01485 [Eucalyptus grandis]KAK3409357.1 hypothetical protein EUGRSUZ_J01485 [Eucalyptus grandis]
MEERCLRLEWSLASQSLKISALKSKIAALDAEYDNNVQRLRELKCEVEELEEAEKDGFYRAQTGEMKDFKEATNGFVVDCQIRMEELRDELNEVLKMEGQLLNYFGFRIFTPTTKMKKKKKKRTCWNLEPTPEPVTG